MTSCKSSNQTITFKDLIGLAERDITKIEFRDGGTGALFRTTDERKINEFWDFLNEHTYKKAKQPEPFTGYTYAGQLTSLNKETKIGFAKNMLSLDMYYNIIPENETDFDNYLRKIVESFGKVSTLDGNIP
ncbi:hypothetical protein [Paenibacillus pectinilyticus]|nr:hypothetical protein [Paenibacillus pectinilyticus]